MRRENIYSSSGYVITNLLYNPLLRKPVSYEPALDVASACHRDERGESFFFFSLSKIKTVERKETLPRVFYIFKNTKAYTPRYAIQGINRSVALINQAII